MDLQRFQALGGIKLQYSANGNKTDDTIVNALKYQDQASGASPQVDPDAEFIILGYQASMDQVGNFFLENASGGTGAGADTKTVLPKQFMAANSIVPLVDAFIPVGQGKPIMVTALNPGNFSLVLYVIDRAYVNRRRVPIGT